MNYLSLFSGFGGLDMAVEELWPDAVCVAHCENNKAASTVLAARWPDVSNLHDVTTADWSQVGDVDLIVGGFPCTDISHAGKRAGITEETRSGLWFYFRDAIRTLRPRLVLVENVSAVTAAGGGLDVVLGSLAEIGFDAEWGVLRASDVGAPHRRERWFAVAWPTDADGPRLVQRWRSEPVRPQQPAAEHVREDALTLFPTLAVNDMGAGKTVEAWDVWTDDLRSKHGNGNGHGKSLAIEAQRMLPTPRSSDGPHGGPNQTGDGLQPAVRTLPTPTSADARDTRNATSRRSNPDSQHNSGWTLNDVRHADRWGDYAPAIARWEHVLGRPAPGPTDEKGRLSPDFVEFLMGWPDGWSDGLGLSRAGRLKGGGNGVVTLQAVAAYAQLLGRVEVAA